ncbi:hypothetical protein CEE36_08805 [candidate division TA06 bacterium B3_TA06]|uniref:Uncharacterized protein n=1 Tax=candidate division TA06 bacterium B3_TA06 TaxID=2012487 RepID=A0A532V167_UNCT6|nr:MAG: hypothetical protein CEE36_08805 [candidate division TA06 bacterium B3_TA06]
MAKKIFCITERSFHYVAAESKEDALKVIEQEDPLWTHDEGYGDVRMLSKSEAEEIGLEKFHEDNPLPEPEENKYPEPGKCPVCNRLGRLEYDGKAIMEGEHIYYRFTCPDCGATGKEWYEITFDSIVADQKDDSHA